MKKYFKKSLCFACCLVMVAGVFAKPKKDNSGNWYFLTLADFGGSAVAEKTCGEFHIIPKSAGSEVHSIQLLQHLGVAKGYTYQISFEAKASCDQTISVKLGGDDDNKWAVYSSMYSPKLSEEYKSFKYRFTMENDSDAQGRLEFNVGNNNGEVWIKNVKVIRLED